MIVRLPLFGLVVTFAVAAAPLPQIPIGFELTGNGYSAQANRVAIEVNSRGFSLGSAGGKVTIEVSGANSRGAISGHGSAGLRNWFIGNNPAAWRINVPLFERVDISRIYPGIDLSYYGQDSHLEYDFVVAPHSDPTRIELQIDGAGPLQIDRAGNLQAAQFIQHRPAAYQIIHGGKQSVESRFRLTGNRVRFAVGAYDHSRELIIDPIVAYSSFLGGIGTDEAHAVAVDTQGDFFVAGRTFSTTNSNSNVLLVKVPASGAIVQSVFGGTVGNDSANAIVADSSGNVYLADSTTSADFPIGGANIYQGELLGTMNAFVMAFNPTLSAIIFSTYLGGSFSDQALGIALGPNSNVYVVGDTESANLSLISTGAFQSSNHGGFDAFVVSFTTQGVANYGSYLGGSGDDHAYGVAVDSAGAIYVVGATTSTDFPADPTGFPTPFQLTNHGGEDGFAIKLTPSGQDAYWSTYLGGENADAANAVALDAAGNIYIAGTTGSNAFPGLAWGVPDRLPGAADPTALCSP